MKARLHVGSVTWTLRRDRDDYVRTTPLGLLLHVNGDDMSLDRDTARLLAKRIKQCLADKGAMR